MRRFMFEGQDWDVVPDGIGIGVGTGSIPDPNHWLVTFTCVSDPERGEDAGHVWDRDLSKIDDAGLRRALQRAIAKKSE